MNQTIKLFVNLQETRQIEKLKLVKELFSVQVKISKLIKIIEALSTPLEVDIRISSTADSYSIIFRSSDYPMKLIFFLPKAVFNVWYLDQTAYESPVTLLNSIYRTARDEYNRIGEIYNKRSSVMFSKNRLPTLLNYPKYKNDNPYSKRK